MIPEMMPPADNNIGYIIAFQSDRISLALAITRAAQVDSAKEPNKSAPIPAISPTLSPTLSAMHAGFLGSSSSIPYSFFPERSAPTSAALVKMPPPTRQKSATEDAPSPYPARASQSSTL